MLKIEYTLRVSRQQQCGNTPGQDREASKLTPALPRITRLMALAIKLNGDARIEGPLDPNDIALLGGVSRSRVTQILNLLLLAPDLQERLLFLPAEAGGARITEARLRRLSAECDWEQQRLCFEALFRYTDERKKRRAQSPA